MKEFSIVSLLIASILVFVLVSGISGCAGGEFQLTPKEKTGEITEKGATEVGTGWSANENSSEAIKEAIEMALKEKVNKPDFAIIFASSGSNMSAILSGAKELLGNDIGIYGGTSDSRGVMTEKGYVSVSEKGYEYGMMGGKRGLVVMTISSEEIVFGAGSADFTELNFSNDEQIREKSKNAILDAIKNAGKSQNETPNIVLITPTKPFEDFVLDGIDQVVKKETIVLGGTAGGPAGSVIGKDKVYDEGVSLAVIYTDLPIGWVFEGGFDVVEPKSGIVTNVSEDGRDIHEIDNKPALDVYNEWLNGEVDRLYNEYKDPRVVKNLLTLHPLYRRYNSAEGQEYNLFSHPWPTDPEQKEKSVSTSTNIKKGEKVYLSHGTWEILLNRIGNLPKKARINGNIEEKPVLGIGIICAGVMGTIPEEERGNMNVLINHENDNAQFIATFTWGEQGSFSGIGHKHGNLLTSFIVIGKRNAK